MQIRKTLREKRGLHASEHTEAVRFMRVVRMHEPRYPALRWLHHIPNGGWRNTTVAAKLRAEGVRPGVSDYCWPYPRGDWHGLFIELKSATGRPSPDQRAFMDFVREQGYRVVVARGWEEAWKAVCQYAGIDYRVI